MLIFLFTSKGDKIIKLVSLVLREERAPGSLLRETSVGPDLLDKEEGKELRNIEIAKSMLAKNLSMDTISAVTGLSLEQVEALK